MRTLASLKHVHQIAFDEWEAACPAHHDEMRSLSVRTQLNGSWRLYCHHGCSQSSIALSLGLPIGNRGQLRG